MEKRKTRIQYAKSGKGSVTTRITLPVIWVRELELTPDDREVMLTLEDNKITIRKITKEDI